jgi:hypothetical protein
MGVRFLLAQALPGGLRRVRSLCPKEEHAARRGRGRWLPMGVQNKHSFSILEPPELYSVINPVIMANIRLINSKMIEDQ